MSLEQQILTSLQRIERQTRPQKKWVGAHWIIKATGWDWKDLQQARRDGLIGVRKKPGKRGYEYNINDVPEALRKNKHNEPEAA